MPPARPTLQVPASSRSCTSMVAFMPEPHILVRVVDGTAGDRPAPSTAWRAGACFRPAYRQQPRMASSMSAAWLPMSASTPAMAALPSCGAVTGANCPWKAPMGVRRAATMTMGSVMKCSFLFGAHADGAVDANDFAVQVGVADDVAHEAGKLGRLAQARGEGHHLAQRVLHLLRHAQQHRRFHDAGGDGHDADAEAAQFAGDRQRHGHDAALGR